mgnify:CR=1 FL=1
MKKIISVLTILLIIISCSRDEQYIDEVITELPEVGQLEIEGKQGLKLESYIVTKQVKINTKLPSEGIYRIKIYNFVGELVNQERIKGVEGDNLFNIYVSALPTDSYTVKLQTIDNQLIGEQLFSKN